MSFVYGSRVRVTVAQRRRRTPGPEPNLRPYEKMVILIVCLLLTIYRISESIMLILTETYTPLYFSSYSFKVVNIASGVYITWKWVFYLYYAIVNHVWPLLFEKCWLRHWWEHNLQITVFLLIVKDPITKKNPRAPSNRRLGQIDNEFFSTYDSGPVVYKMSDLRRWMVEQIVLFSIRVDAVKTTTFVRSESGKD